MTLIRIDELESKQLDPYRNLRTTNLTRFSGRFIAESKPLVSRLISSPIAVESVLIDEAYLDEAMAWIPGHLDMYVVPTSLISELIGFHFHRGYLACGFRPTPKPYEAFLKNAPTGPATEPGTRWTGVLLVGVQDPENLGSILRTCSALGIQDVFMGPNCVDPFARRVLRVSMGNAFKLNFYDVELVPPALDRFRSHHIESISACLTSDSEELSQFRRNGHSLILFGNEAQGLPPEIQVGSSRRLKIAMDLATDSLNVSVAAGIILHNLCRIC